MPRRAGSTRRREEESSGGSPLSAPAGCRRGPGLLAVLLLLFASCRPATAPAPPPAQTRPSDLRLQPRDERLLDTVERRTFDFFWELANPSNGLVPDRWPSPSFSSIAAVGFGLTAYPIGVERGWVTRAAARDRVLTTLRFFAAGPRGPEPSGRMGDRGFFYHFLDMTTGLRFEKVELSTIDTTLLLAGALFCGSYFDGADAGEREIRSLSESLYAAADWPAMQARPPLVSMAWSPEEGLSSWDWRGYDEAMILYVLALGSPTHPIEPRAWGEWTRTYRWERFEGLDYVNFPPLFGYQYAPVWIDFRGIQDAYMRRKGIDYFENSRRATYAQRSYAIRNPGAWKGYGENVWGLTACDGPVEGTFMIDGRKRTFFDYAARGASAHEARDDGTIAPTAAVSSLPFAPEIVLPAIDRLSSLHGENLFGRYGFLDAFNATFQLESVPHAGRVVAGVGWFDTDYLGIDQGPIVAMIENYRSELVWKTMRRSPHIRRGLDRAGFTGGWLGSAPR